MSKKVLIVGGVAGGASVAARVRRLDEDAEIIVFERGPHVSFSNCSLPYYLSRTVAKSDSLIMMTPERFQKSYRIEVRTENEVLSIDRENKTIRVHNAKTNEDYEENYDVLVLSPGGAPIMPKSIVGIDGENVFGIRNVVDVVRFDQYMTENNVESVAVIGGGFIGLEVAENLIEAGKKVTIVEAADQILTTFDHDMVQMLHKEVMDHGIELILNNGLKEIQSDKVILSDGKEVPCQAVVMAVGVRPEITLATNAGLTIGKTGAIQVDEHFLTNDPNIYAVGDAIEVTNDITKEPMRLALAWPAQMEARAAANHMYGLNHSVRGFIGSSVLRVFDFYAARTGLKEQEAKDKGYQVDSVYLMPQDKVGIMPNSKPIHFKLIYEVPSGKILGAQAIGPNNADRRIDVIATMIHMNGTVYDLCDLELCYAPVVSTAKDVVNMAGLVATNLLSGAYKHVPVTSVRKLVEEGACIIDVREESEYENGHIINAKNIPLSKIRNRLEEIPHDQPVYLHCRSSQRSYNAVCMLQNKGFDNVINIDGSFLGLSLYEYAQDVLQNRKKIVTAYNFK